MANKRLFYAIKQVAIKPDGDTGNYASGDVIYGGQDVSISTNFNLTPLFQLGQLEIYQNLEELPDVEVSVSKIFDGYPLIWHLSTRDATAPDLAGRSNSKCIIGLGLFPDGNRSATGIPNSVVECSGMYPRTINYNFTTDGAFTESLTLVGNDKIFSTDEAITSDSVVKARQNLITGAAYFDGHFDNVMAPVKIERKENLNFTTSVTGEDVNGYIADPDCTILPNDIEGVGTKGVNDLTSETRAIVQSIAISTDLGRESLNELGRRGPYHRYATFPTEVTCAIECLSQEGDGVSAVEDGIYNTGGVACAASASNLKDSTIRLATDCGVRIYLGTKNRLSSVDFGGGTTDGGNDTNTYNFTNYNALTVMASYDPHAENSGGAAWWTNREDWLVDL